MSPIDHETIEKEIDGVKRTLYGLDGRGGLVQAVQELATIARQQENREEARIAREIEHTKFLRRIWVTLLAVASGGVVSFIGSVALYLLGIKG
jgi:uncharacterized membrane protein YgcG